MSSTNGSPSLHYTSPASEWSQALPLGNGRLGCMVHGRTTTELLQLNEDSVWYGGVQERTPRDALRNLPQLRQLIREGRHAEAENLVKTAFFATPASMRHYEPLGSCSLEFGHDQNSVTEYCRELDLDTAQHTVTYRHDGVLHQRQTIASFPDNVLATKVTSSGKVRAVIRLNRVSEVEWETNEYLDTIQSSEGAIVLHATPGGRDANRLCIVLGVYCDDDGTVEAIGNCLIVNSSSFIFAMGAHTTYRHADPEAAARRDVSAALSRSWDELLLRHSEDYRSLFGRTSLRLWPDASNVPTDERINNQRDPGLAALYHNYGRYLLIASSRASPKALPATLQGIWNPSFAPPWGSKYTININLQMNYWPAAASNLFECVPPLVDLVERMAERGRVTAQTMYGCKGWCAHHNTDIWADTDPQDRWMPSTVWPLGGVWLCVDVFEMLQYRYNRSLHERVAPLLEGCVDFLLDYLIPSEDGQYLVTNPSLSPENTFISADGSKGILCEGSAIDTTIIRIAFNFYLWSNKKLGISTATKEFSVRSALGQTASSPQLPDLLISPSGLIQEWGLRDYDEDEPGHRHVSHLFALYPGNLITRAGTPALFAASRRVLDRRAAHGGGHTGWSRAWLLNLHARLGDAEGCAMHMDALLKSSTLPNLLDSHPPFQIDGNFGGCAGVLECLVQSTISITADGEERATIVLLPACPGEWKTGRVKGVHVRGGWKVSFGWEEKQVQGELEFEATQEGPLKGVAVYPSGKKIELIQDSRTCVSGLAS